MLRRAALQASRSLLSAAAEASSWSSSCARAAAGAGASTSSSATFSYSPPSSSAADLIGRRGFFASAASRRAEPAQIETDEGMPVQNSQRVGKIVDEILQLNLLEVRVLFFFCNVSFDGRRLDLDRRVFFSLSLFEHLNSRSHPEGTHSNRSPSSRTSFRSDWECLRCRSRRR